MDKYSWFGFGVFPGDLVFSDVKNALGSFPRALDLGTGE